MIDQTTSGKKGFSGLQVFFLIIFSVLLAVGITVWLFLSDVFTTRFEPVVLNQQEDQVLHDKFKAIGVQTDNVNSNSSAALEPEAYSEANADRAVRFSERELNAMLAKNTNLAEKLALDLSGDLLSAKLLVPLDPQMPILGGQTLKVTAGVELAYRNERPVVIVKGVSVWGVPIPSAYLGDFKNVDLVNQFGGQGFWRQFSDGVDNIVVKEGEIFIQLKP